jgi:hypothetical protein
MRARMTRKEDLVKHHSKMGERAFILEQSNMNGYE